jgi:acyl-coenzyme A thioesterase PaaI-like protein
MTKPTVTVVEQDEPRASTDLDLVIDQLSATRARSLAPLTDAVRDPAGAASLGYLVIATDVTAAMVSICASVPDVTVTVDLMLHEMAPLVQGPTVLECNLVKSGARLIAVSVDVFEGAGLDELTELGETIELARVATGIVNFARAESPTARMPHVADPLSFTGRRRHYKPFGELPTEPLFDRCGIEIVDAAAGVVDMPHVAYNHNNRDRISGGVIGVAFEAAAEATHPGYACSDIAIHYLSAARVGPLRTRTTIVRETEDHAVCRIEAYDAGSDDEVLAAQATVTLQRFAP